ncbi:MAG: ATP synthase F0 subunit B [Bryobacteraceae bacterium]
MGQTLQALGGLMLKAIPTICLLILVYYYLKLMLFRPLERVIRRRDELTIGARKSAEQSLAAAERKEQEYARKFDEARAEVYRAQEETRRQWLDQQSALIEDARKRSEEKVNAAKQEIAADAVSARDNLAASSGQLADEIASAILDRKVGSAA